MKKPGKQKHIIGLIISSIIIVSGFLCYLFIYLPAQNNTSSLSEINNTNNIEELTCDTLAKILDNIHGGSIAMQHIMEERCQYALLNYFADDDLKDNWEIYRTLKNGEQYTPFKDAVTDHNPKFNDLAVILQNIQNGERKVVVFGFNSDESLAWTRDFDIPCKETDDNSAVYGNINSDDNNENNKDSCFILVSKQELKLSVYDYEGNEISKFPIACSAFYGNKKIKGDHKTPEGIFPITEVLYSAYISHDFKDGKGEIPGAYGPYFLRI